MTWRAFGIGLAAVAGLSLLDPFTSYIKGYGWLIVGSFPAGALLILVLLTLGLNVALKLVHRAWALTQPELMLVWCMLIVGATIPTEGIGRWWYTMLAGGPYMARRPDVQWTDDGALTHAPEALVLSRDFRSVAARQYYEGADSGRVPWRVWTRPLLHWMAFLVPLFLAVFFLCGILRRQWVESERLMFPLARVPLEFTEGCDGPGLLPALFSDKAFLVGVALTAAFRLLRDVPVFFGAGAWGIVLPFEDVLRETPLEPMDFDNLPLWLPAVGFAFLVPADVSLSVWLFYILGRVELLVGHWLALPEAAGGTWSPMMQWQQFGAYVAFAAGTLFVARRHLWRVLKAALGRRGAPDDSREPIGYRLAFWGFWASLGACMVWYAYHGMKLTGGVLALALILLSYFVYARVVAQGGVLTVRTLWEMPRVMESVAGNGVFSARGAVIASAQSSLLLTLSTTVMAPMVMNSFRISDVFGRRRRWLFPALLATLPVALVCTTWVVLTQAYRMGAVNFSGSWEVSNLALGVFGEAQRIIGGQSSEWTRLHVRPAVIGAGATGLVMFLRARFYWWPVHAIGLLTCSSWNMGNRLWFPFFLGWLVKWAVMRFAGGNALRKARSFLLGLIVVESSVSGLSAVVGTLTGGAAPGF